MSLSNISTQRIQSSELTLANNTTLPSRPSSTPPRYLTRKYLEGMSNDDRKMARTEYANDREVVLNGVGVKFQSDPVPRVKRKHSDMTEEDGVHKEDKLKEELNDMYEVEKQKKDERIRRFGPRQSQGNTTPAKKPKPQPVGSNRRAPATRGPATRRTSQRGSPEPEGMGGLRKETPKGAEDSEEHKSEQDEESRGD